MLRPTPMKHVRLLVIDEDLPRASLTLAELASFHADDRPPEEDGFAGQPSGAYRDIWRQASSRLEKILRLIPLPPEDQAPSPRVIPEEELTTTNNWLGSLWETCSRYEEQFRAIDDEERLIREQQSALSNFEGLGIDLGMLRSKTRFLDFYVGLVPYANVRQLEGAVGLADHLLFQYMVTGDDAHVVIVGPSGDKEAQLESVLRSAGFRPLPIPPELDHEPQVMRAELARRREASTAQRETLRQRLQDWSADLIPRLASSREVLRLAEPLVQLDAAIRGVGPLARLAGWVPATAVAALEARLRQTLSLPFDLSSRDPRPDERALVPTIATRNRLLAPFALLVQQYGIPRYGEIDPTPLFAASFLLMFGTMFGDVGQGAVIAGLAWYFRRKLGPLYLFGVLAGLSSIAFGFVFGSVFGFEHWLPALWMPPLHDPLLMLSLALGWGVFFIAVACVLATYNRLVIGNWAGALFGPHGLVNLVFYLALAWGGYNVSQGEGFGHGPLLLVILSLGALAWHGWGHLEAPIAEKVLVVFIETLETLVGYVSNTLSFLRVAAFSLNHAALALAIFTLAEMMGPVGHGLTLILGNVFMIVLEGGIVLIQVLRLEFYEGFARYFAGDGHAFKPLRLGPVPERGSAP